MKGPNKLITILFLGALVYGVVKLLPSLVKEKVASIPQNITATKMQEAETDQIAIQKSVQESNEDMLRKQARLKILTWNRNPFLISKDLYKKSSISGETRALSEGAETPAQEEAPIEIKLSAIMITGQQKVAAIERAPYIVKIGDWIEKEKVLEIKDDRIIIGKEGNTREIFIETEGLGK